jgi:hypothetical protein
VNRKRLLGTLSIALAVVVAGACGGSAVRSDPGGPPSTNSPAPKLELASAGPAPTAAAVAGGAALYPERPTSYVLDATLPDLGATARVRRMKAHSVGVSDVQRFADALGVAGTPTRTPTGWHVQGADAILQFDIGGVVSMSYSRGVPGAVGGSTGSGVASDPGGAVVNGPETKPVPPTPAVVPTDPVAVPPPAPPAPPVDVPNAADAETMARALLDRFGVLSGQSWATDVTDSGGVAVACPVGVPCPTVPPEVSARTVTFSLLVDGMRVDGVQWSVTIGEHRRIEYVNGEWATATDLGEYPLRSAAAVFSDLQHGTARYAGPRPMMADAGPAAGGAPEIASVPPAPSTMSVVTVHVTGVLLGLARWNADDSGVAVVDLVPTYRFRGRVDGGEPYDIVLLALDPSAARFTDSVPVPKPLQVQPAPAPAPAPSAVPGTAASPPPP